MDPYLWSLDHSLKPTSHICASRGRHNIIETLYHQTGGSSVAHPSRQLPCCEPSENLGASTGSAQSPPCGLEHQCSSRQCLEIPPPFNSLGKLPTLCAQPFLIDDTEDCNYVHKVFLGVPTGVYGHVEVGIVWKLDLQ